MSTVKVVVDLLNGQLYPRSLRVFNGYERVTGQMREVTYGKRWHSKVQ